MGSTLEIAEPDVFEVAEIVNAGQIELRNRVAPSVEDIFTLAEELFDVFFVCYDRFRLFAVSEVIGPVDCVLQALEFPPAREFHVPAGTLPRCTVHPLADFDRLLLGEAAEIELDGDATFVALGPNNHSCRPFFRFGYLHVAFGENQREL